MYINQGGVNELFFAEWLTKERQLALFPVRDFHHCKSPTCCKQDLNLC